MPDSIKNQTNARKKVCRKGCWYLMAESDGLGVAVGPGTAMEEGPEKGVTYNAPDPPPFIYGPAWTSQLN